MYQTTEIELSCTTNTTTGSPQLGGHPTNLFFTTPIHHAPGRKAWGDGT
ncbi:hypothetical protein [Bacillus sp. M6-12]|nr:hypothetical protein [Bacillus sp. M6-12]